MVRCVAWKQTQEYTDRSLSSIAIQGIEEMENHLAGIHDGPGFFTGERRVCRLHPALQPDGQPYKSSQANSCKDFDLGMQKWLREHVIEPIDDVIHPTRGGICQYASERVGMIALTFRDKATPFGPTHYSCSLQRLRGVLHTTRIRTMSNQI